jgi:hypothetical protein
MHDIICVGGVRRKSDLFVFVLCSKTDKGDSNSHTLNVLRVSYGSFGMLRTYEIPGGACELNILGEYYIVACF